eukprot:TRINITY_DN2061_c0_g1_i1.p2 TRINITY_DN2061_c0_g1~~TRINITY_DN2061_c0_g1_i1.p2  ORF type:complete len:116 (-),score=33.40 TRINITY_DN2061_c0_g1_i1:223-570(-)
MIRRPPRSTLSSSSAASDVYKRQGINAEYGESGSKQMATGNTTKAPEISTIEEDDEFEEFEEEGLVMQTTGLVRTESSIAPKWQDSWDDEDLGDDFIHHLRSELKTTSSKMAVDV